MIRGINNAGTKRAGPFPDMGGVLAGWENRMIFKKITDTIVDYENVKTEINYPFEGVFQPMPPREIYFKKEGQRDWKWWSLWTRTEYDINNGDNIEDFNGLKFRVLRKSDWTQGGYTKFDIVQDYMEAP